MSGRRNIGYRDLTCTFRRHNGNRNASGNPTYDVADDWDVVQVGWYCQKTTVNGKEVLRGRQVTEQTTHVLFGDYFGNNLLPGDRAEVDGETLEVVSAYDPFGDRMEKRVECKREV